MSQSNTNREGISVGGFRFVKKNSEKIIEKIVKEVQMLL
jgi:hypothetical protein